MLNSKFLQKGGNVAADLYLLHLNRFNILPYALFFGESAGVDSIIRSETIMSFLHMAERKGFALLADQIIAHRNDHEKWTSDMLHLVDMSEKFLGSFYGKDIYVQARKQLKENGRWARFALHALQSVHPRVAKTAALNGGFQAAFLGRQKTLSLSEKYGINIPWIILMDPTSRCNMHCTGCWAAEYGHTLDISYETLDRIISEGENMGIYFYMMTGGEPMTRWNDIRKLAASHPCCEFMLFTNATLINPENVQEMTALGNIALSISIEGFEETNDSRRGKGCFRRVMKAMDLLHRQGMLFGSSTCYTKKNIPDVMSDRFFNLLIDRGCLFAWFFHYMPVGQDAAPALLPTPDQRAYVYHRIREVRRSSPDGQGRFLFPMDFQNDGEFVNGCIAGGRCYCHINSNGDMEPCVFIHYSNMNIKNHSLLECLSQPLFRVYKKRQPFNHNHLRPCPMLENPEILGQMIREVHAPSTDLMAPEQPDNLFQKCISYAAAWTPEAEKLWKESHPESTHGSNS